MKVTVNEMLYKTLHTKITKEPKYKEVLEALGYELSKDHDWSSYDYWGIMAADGTVVVISKTREGKKALFKTAHLIRTNNITKVDLSNLIKTKREPVRGYYETWSTCKGGGWRRYASKKIYDYHVNKYHLRLENNILANYSKEEEKLSDELSNIRRKKEVTENRIKKYQEALNKVLGKI